MAVPKKKNSNYKSKYNYLKNKYVNDLNVGLFKCKCCSKYVNIKNKNFGWKSKTCINCIKKIK